MTVSPKSSGYNHAHLRKAETRLTHIVEVTWLTQHSHPQKAASPLLIEDIVADASVGYKPDIFYEGSRSLR